MKKVLLFSALVAIAGCSGGSSAPTASTTGSTPTATTGTSGASTGATFTSAAVASTAAPVTGTAFSTKDGKLEITAPSGWMKVDVNDQAFKDALTKTAGPNAVKTFEQLGSQVDLMVIDLGKKSAFADNANVIPQPLPKAIASDKDLEDIFTQMKGTMNMPNIDHKLVKFPAGPTLCYWGTINQGASKNDLIGFVLPGSGTNAYILTFSTAEGKAEGFRQTAEGIMQTVKLK